MLKKSAILIGSRMSSYNLHRKFCNTCPTSISVWNFLAETPDVVYIDAPLQCLLTDMK